MQEKKIGDLACMGSVWINGLSRWVQRGECVSVHRCRWAWCQQGAAEVGREGLRGRGRAERMSGEGEGISREGGSAEENGGWRDGERVRESGEGERVQRWRESDRE